MNVVANEWTAAGAPWFFFLQARRVCTLVSSRSVGDCLGSGFVTREFEMLRFRLAALGKLVFHGQFRPFSHIL